MGDELEVPMTVRLRDTRILQGGLMRCCIQTVRDIVAEDPDREIIFDTDEPDVFDCKFEDEDNQQLLLTPEGFWKWNHT